MAFPVTHQSILERVQSGDTEVRRAAFGDLTEGYWRPSYHYLRLHWRLPPDEAEDVVQGFFATAFEKRYLERYDPAKAKFRTFLRTCLDRFVQNHRKAARAGKRGGESTVLSLDFPGAEHELAALASRDLSDVERFFHDETIRALFARVVDALRRAYAEEDRAVVFQVFERHDLAPSTETTYATVARELNLSTAQVTNYLHAARRRFRETALTELRALVGTDEEFRAEARELFGVDVDA
jgi:RNA polymerase sigma factor (sigma-70 family)